MGTRPKLRHTRIRKCSSVRDSGLLLSRIVIFGGKHSLVSVRVLNKREAGYVA